MSFGSRGFYPFRNGLRYRYRWQFWPALPSLGCPAPRLELISNLTPLPWQRFSRSDRNAALRRQRQMATMIDARHASCSIRRNRPGYTLPATSPLTRSSLRGAITYLAGSSIAFFPTGMSCGGVVTLSRLGIGYEVRVNWLTGGVEVVPLHRA